MSQALCWALRVWCGPKRHIFCSYRLYCLSNLMGGVGYGYHGTVYQAGAF